MTKLNPLSRAVATATALLGACLLALASPTASSAATKAKSSGAGENTPLNLGPVSTGTHSSGSSASIVRTIVGLAIVIAVIWGLSWILRQVKAGREPSVASTGLTSIAALTLSSGRSVHLVRAGSDYLLLGSAEHGVVPIHRYTEEQAREAGLMDVIDAPARPRRALLRPPSPPAAGGGDGHDPMRMPAPGSGLVDRLRELTVRR
jgi:flagellar protein FliO/FliZ